LAVSHAQLLREIDCATIGLIASSVEEIGDHEPQISGQDDQSLAVLETKNSPQGGRASG
jgi:hypothetical protein